MWAELGRSCLDCAVAAAAVSSYSVGCWRRSSFSRLNSVVEARFQFHFSSAPFPSVVVVVVVVVVAAGYHGP